MSKFTKIIFVLAVASLAVMAANGLIHPITLLVLLTAVIFCGSVGWFFLRFPLPPVEHGQDKRSLDDLLEAYRKHYPGWQGKLVFYGLLALMLAELIFLSVDLLSSYY